MGITSMLKGEAKSLNRWNTEDIERKIIRETYMQVVKDELIIRDRGVKKIMNQKSNRRGDVKKINSLPWKIKSSLIGLIINIINDNDNYKKNLKNEYPHHLINT